MTDTNRFTALFARILLGVVFLASGAMKIAGFSMVVGFATAKGLPFPAVSIALAAAIEIAGAALLFLGYRARLASFVLFLYLIPTTFIFHNFWAAHGVEAQMQLVNFLKNAAIMGGLLMVASAGPGRIALGEPATQSR
jgi:putative oxidoreductase